MGEALGEVPLDRMPGAFVRGWAQANLSFAQGGLNFRRWAQYADAAFLGKWSLALASSVEEETGKHWFPTLAEVHRNALNGGDQYGTWHTCPVGTMRASWALNKAWHRMHSMALSQARSAEALPTWYQNSRGSLEGLADVGERAQRLISKTVNRKVVQDYKRHIAGDVRVEGALN